MTRSLHIRSKIFFPNPYVVRLEYINQSDTTIQNDHRNLIRKTYKFIHGTWGHTSPDYEILRTTNEGPPDYGQKVSIRSYFCFKDELDALQFRLGIGEYAIQTVMWPSHLKFTIHEVIETDDQ